MSAETLITDNLDLWTGAITKRITSGRGSNKKIELTGIHKLRHLILELACHGKIVPQLASETPACEVLEGLQLRRKELIRKKKIKNSKPLPNVSAEEEPSKLPSNWVWTRLGSIAEINPRNNAEDGTEASFVPMPLITTSYHGDHGHETKPWGKIKKGYTHFADGDVALAKITPCFENSKAAVFRGLINGLGAGTTELHVARPLGNAVNPYYLILFLKSPRFLIEGEKVMTGSAGQKRVPKDYFSSTPLPLPPTEEQHRIVQKVDELMALCDRLEQQTSDQIAAHDILVDTLLGTLTQSQNATELAENWTRLAAHFDTLFTTEQSIDKLKQTILQLAVMGRLVEQNARDEPAKELLQRIAEARARLVAEGTIKKQKRLAEIDDTEKLFHVPNGWHWVRFGDICAIKGELVRPEKFPELRQIAPDCIEKGTGLITENRTVRESGVKGPNSRFFAGQIVYSKIRPSLSKAVLVDFDGLCSADMYPIDAFIDSKFLLKEILSEVFLQQVRVAENRIKMPKLNQESLKNFVLPIPPLPEQQRIVQKIDELMALCDQLKKRLNQASETRCQLAETIVENALQ